MVTEVTVGLAESNGSLPPGLWLWSPAGWLPRTGISSYRVWDYIYLHLLRYCEVTVKVSISISDTVFTNANTKTASVSCYLWDLGEDAEVRYRLHQSPSEPAAWRPPSNRRRRLRHTSTTSRDQQHTSGSRWRHVALSLSPRLLVQTV